MKQSTILTIFTIFITCLCFTSTFTTATRKLFGLDPIWGTKDDDFLLNNNNNNFKDVEFQTFTQWVDHFDPTNMQTFQQRYLINDEHFQESEKYSPIFLFIGAEGTLSKKWVTSQLPYEWCAIVKCKLIGLEHRYYGESHVTTDLTTPNLRWLTTYQALEDVAFFIKSFPELQYRPWITFGGSYGGSLSAYTRLKFPSLVAGAISSSGPFDPVIDFTDYLVVAENALKYYGGDKCIDDMEEANKQLYEQYFKTKTQSRFDELTNKLHLCRPLKLDLSTLDEQSFWQGLTDSFASIVQYNKEVVADDALNLQKVCDKFASSNDKLATLIEIHNIVKGGGDEQCRDWDWKWQVDQLSDIALSPNNAYRLWIYQSCTNYGYFQTNIGQTRAFGQHWPIEFFGELCQKVYGNDYNLARLELLSKSFNATMNGRDWRSNGVIFTNGNIDPWSALSIYKDNSYMYTNSHFINGTSHCATLYASSPNDSKLLSNARDKMFQQLKAILQNFPFTMQ